MKKLALPLFIAFTIIQLNCYSQIAPSTNAYLDINNVKALFWNNGNNFWDHACNPKFIIPKNSSTSAIFSQTLWIGGYNGSGTLLFAGDRYCSMGMDFFPGPYSNIYDSLFDQKWNRIWVVNKTQVEDFVNWHNNPQAYPSYVIPSDIEDWPAHGDTALGQTFDLAPFFDNNGDGIYNTSDGDYPVFKGDQVLLYFMNDNRYYHTETGGNKIVAEFRVMAYAYNCPNDLNNTIFMEYTINKKSPGNLDSTRIGIFTDFDLGYANNDLIGTDVQRGMVYCYNGVAIDGDTNNQAHYGKNPPAIGITILKGTKLEDDNIDNPRFDQQGQPKCDESINGLNFENGIPDDEYSGLFGSLFLKNTDSVIVDPSTAPYYYKNLSLTWGDDSHLVYGGTGHNSSVVNGINCNYVFPGLSDSCNFGLNGQTPNVNQNWNDTFISSTIPIDRRALNVLKPSTLYQNSPITIEYAIVWARDTVNRSIDALKNAVDTVRYFYQNGVHPCGGNFLGISSYEKNEQFEIKIFPNPGSDLLNIASETAELENYEIFNLEGKSMLSGKLTGQLTTLDINHLQGGIYIVKLSSQNKTAVKKFVKIN